MIVLGIESSCDETAAAVVRDGLYSLSSVIASSADLHSVFGGVVPEVASREHIKAIAAVCEQALSEAALSLADIDAIAVTSGPGLIGALLVGVSYAKALAYRAHKPLYAVHHIAGHVSANFLAEPNLKPPFICLVASGGHSHIFLVEEYCKFRVLGATRDDAAGEAFDKIARAVGLGYPGGPKVDKEARGGDRRAIQFPVSKLSGNPLDFSFSGLKTSALNFLQKMERLAEREGQSVWSYISRKDFCASYQEAIIDVLCRHTLMAAKESGVKQVAIAGGVAANSRLREVMASCCAESKLSFYCPPPVLCTDNAMMIASMGGFMAMAGLAPAGLALDATAGIEITQLMA